MQMSADLSEGFGENSDRTQHPKNPMPLDIDLTRRESYRCDEKQESNVDNSHLAKGIANSFVSLLAATTASSIRTDGQREARRTLKTA